MHIQKIIAATALFVAATFSAAQAAPITYTLSGMFDGSVNGTPVTGGRFTWTITGNTSVVFPLGSGVFGVPAITDTIDVTGFGTLVAATPSAFVSASVVAEEGFFVANVDNVLLFGAPGLVGYNGISSIGPMPVLFSSATPVPTDHGDFTVSSASLLVFQASTVPEPLTLTLFGAGLAGLAAMRRRKQKT